jgi:SAM-dependent methyltransferase
MTKAPEEQFYDSYYKEKGIYDKSDYKITDGLDVEDKRILSLGCGTCEDIYYLLEKNEVWGLDSSPNSVKTARELGVKAEVANLEDNLRLPDEYFDIVVCKDLLEHLLKPENLLREIHRVLKNDGVLVLNVPNQFYWRFRLSILFGGNLIWKTFFHDHTKHFEEWDYMHIRFFTYHGLLKLLDLCGFEIDKAFWDFGMLAHYADPDRFTKEFQSRLSGESKLSPLKRNLIKILLPAYRTINFIFPRKIRSKIVSLNPALLCASIYFRCVKSSQ